MKKLIILLLVTQTVLSLYAQNVPYETLDHFSKEINGVQSPIQNLNYDDGTIDSEMSFPESGLQLYFHNQLASNAVYKKVGEKEYLLVTDNIDFAKATVVKGMALGGMAGAIRVYFPEDYISSTIYENGVVFKSFNTNYLDFYYDKTDQQDKSKLRCVLNELIAVLKEDKKKPYASFLHQAIYYNVYDNDKKETLLQKLINEGDSEAMLLKGRAYGLEKNYTKAVEWFERSYKLGNVEALYELGISRWLGRGYPEDTDEGRRLINQAAGMGSSSAMDNLAVKHMFKSEYSQAIDYLTRAIAKGFSYDKERAAAYKSLFYHYSKLGQYDKIGAIINNDSFYELGLSEVQMLEAVYDLLTGNGSCKEAVAYFTKATEGKNTKDVNAKVYEYLSNLYQFGCDGSKGNKVKKDKKLHLEYATKAYSFK